jgi:hypothetical protein
MHRIERWLSRETAITIAVFIVGGHAAITMDGAITVIGAVTMPRSWSLRRTGTITTIDLLLVDTREQEPGPSGRVLLLLESLGFSFYACLLLALSGHIELLCTCPLWGVKRTQAHTLRLTNRVTLGDSTSVSTVVVWIAVTSDTLAVRRARLVSSRDNVKPPSSRSQGFSSLPNLDLKSFKMSWSDRWRSIW